MEGLKIVISALVPPALTWNLNIVMKRLMGPLFEPLHSCPFQFLFWKVTFLVTITSLRHVSELQALTMEEPIFKIHRYRVELHTNPKFLPKVVSPQSIEIPVFFPQP